MDVDAEIAVLLQTLRLEHNREQPVTDVDDEALKRVHEKIQAVIKMEVDPERFLPNLIAQMRFASGEEGSKKHLDQRIVSGRSFTT